MTTLLDIVNSALSDNKVEELRTYPEIEHLLNKTFTKSLVKQIERKYNKIVEDNAVLSDKLHPIVWVVRALTIKGYLNIQIPTYINAHGMTWLENLVGYKRIALLRNEYFSKVNLYSFDVYELVYFIVQEHKKKGSHSNLNAIVSMLGTVGLFRNKYQFDYPYKLVKRAAKKRQALIKGAKERGLEMTLSFEDVLKLLSVKRCYYTGIRFNETNRSFDRVDSSKGYIPGNVVACLREVNFLKERVIENQNNPSHLTPKQLLMLATKLEKRLN